MNNELKAAAQAVGAGLWTFAVFILLTLPGCGGESLSREGRGLIKDGRVEEGLDRMREAARSDPRDYSLRTGLIEQREKVVFELLTSADADLTAGRTATAEETFQRVLAMHPENPRAQAGLEAVARARRHRAEVSRAIEADSKGQAELALDLQNHVKGLLAPYEYPKEIEFVEALPMTTTGKVQRRVLRLQEEQRARDRSGEGQGG